MQVLYFLHQRLETSDSCMPFAPVIVAKLSTLRKIHDYFKYPCILCYMDHMWQLYAFMNIECVYRMSKKLPLNA